MKTTTDRPRSSIFRIRLLQNCALIFLLLWSIGCQKNTDDLISPEFSSRSAKGSGNNGSISFSGQATAVKATVLGNTTVLSNAGPLPSSGGSEEASLLEASVPGTLSAEVLHATTIGQGNKSEAEASVANLSVTVNGNNISAAFLHSRARAVCNGATATTSGGSEIVSLNINGQAITVSGAPNQTVYLPAGTGKVIINEQITSSGQNSGDITVNALHIIVYNVADIIIASAHADIVCAGNPNCNGRDFVTGGGWITRSGGARANLAVAGGIKNGFWGHLQYIDHGINLKVKGTGVTAYSIVDATTRTISGTCEINGQAGTYTVTVSDKGEPGRTDTFDLQLSNGYHASGTLQGGNIQLHLPCN